MGRQPRAAAKNAKAALKTSSQPFEAEDEQMQDSHSEAGSHLVADDQDADEDSATPAPESEVDEARTPSPEMTQKKRLGRPPKIPREDGDSPATSGPSGRGRGRGGRGGARGGRKGGVSHTTKKPTDKDGNPVDVVNDEVVLPEDPEGEKKVDKLGNLQGGRDYRCRTFTVLGRGDRLYMLSTEPARCVGYRDSYLFFNKCPRLYKVIVDGEEKQDLIKREIIPNSYKGRAIGICTARSVFREFGAQIIVGGKKITDDYEVAKAIRDGFKEGEIADPNDRFNPGQEYNKNQYVAWHGASSVYHSGQPTVPSQTGKVPVGKKQRPMVNDENWMYQHASAASQFNSQLAAKRRQNLNGIYDVHTNSMHYPKIMQPTHAKIVQIDDHAEYEKMRAQGPDAEKTSTIFTPVNPIYSKNYLVLDTEYKFPPYSHLLTPGPDGDTLDLTFNGLSAVSDDVRACLPPECLAEFEKALAQELEWKAQWGDETSSTCRRAPAIDKGVV